MNNNCFNIKKINVKNAIVSCDPNNSNINECKKINICSHNSKCIFLSNCSTADFDNGMCVRKCDTERDTYCYLRDVCNNVKTNVSIKSQPLF